MTKVKIDKDDILDLFKMSIDFLTEAVFVFLTESVMSQPPKSGVICEIEQKETGFFVPNT